MSHFVVAVLSKCDDVESEVKHLLEPYDENIEVDEYETNCHCIGSVAKNDSHDAAIKATNTIDKIRETFNNDDVTKSLRKISALLYEDDVKDEDVIKAKNANKELDKLWKKAIS